MNNNPYKPFPNYVLRTPLFSVDFYKNLTANKKISNGKLRELFEDTAVREAVFLASPPLYEELSRWIRGEEKDPKKTEKLKYSFLKYLSRMSSRCTPFGLFAGCSVGEFGEETKISIYGARNNRRHTRLDMNYLVALSQDLVKKKDIQKQLFFYPNSSIYRAGDQFRYIEYKFVNSKRYHQIVAVDYSEYLSIILEKAAKGALLTDLANTLVNKEISYIEAAGFVEELVCSQLLISELEPSVSGPEFLEQIWGVLKRLKGTDEVLNILNKVDAQIKKLDQNIGNTPENYITLNEFLKQLETSTELKYLFQTDMVLEVEKNILDKTVIDTVKKGMSLLNKITLPPKHTLLDQFKTTFNKRFEEREVPLSVALDVEMGIGYRQSEGAGDVNPLVDDLVIPGRKARHEISEVKWSPIYGIMQKKLVQALAQEDYCIILQDDDFEDYEENWEDLPDTISTMIEVVEEKGELKIKLDGAGGSSAANLFGRFCHGDKKLESHTRQIIDAEIMANNDKVLAEIVHLPESRVGNILMRPVFRQYEIPYLAKSVLPEERQLPIEDLYISVKHGKKLLLRSQKLDKVVIPHLTNAHNYSYNTLPIYHFLCDMQTQELRSGIGFDLGPFADEYGFIPRIEYQNLIFSKATWNLKKKEIQSLEKSSMDDKKLEDAVKIFREKRRIPQYVMLREGDNELLINFKNLTSIRMLLDTVKKRQSFKFTEFFFGEGGVVEDSSNASYANQAVLSFYNSRRIQR